MHDKLTLAAQKSKYSFCSCVCLLVKGLTSHSRLFHSYGDATIRVEGLQILTYTRHSWPLSIEGPLVCHTNCDTEHPLKWSSSITMILTPVAERLAVELSLPSFKTWLSCGWDSNTQPSKYSKQTLLPTAPRRLSFCERLIDWIEFYAVSAIFQQ